MTVVGNAFSSVWAGLIASSICFGIAHAYRDSQHGSTRTSVRPDLHRLRWPGQILHAVMDLNSGLAMGRVVSRDPEHV